MLPYPPFQSPKVHPRADYWLRYAENQGGLWPRRKRRISEAIFHDRMDFRTLCPGYKTKKQGFTHFTHKRVHEFFIIYSVSYKMDTELQGTKKSRSLPFPIFRVNARVRSSNKDTPPHCPRGRFHF